MQIPQYRFGQYRFLGLALVASVGLAACMEGNGMTSGSSGTREARASASASGERDVEDPSIFSKRENGLWDGRPSLGGAWVAHPDVTSPERVIIRNTETGQETIGALFRRERMNPGPSFQVSGEAANAVGMLAGAPTMIEVVALRVEEAPTPAPDAEVAMAAAEDSEVPRDVAAAAESAIARDAAEPERRGGLFGRLFGGRSAEPEPEPAPEVIETQSLDDTEFASAAAPPPRPEAPAAAPAPTPAPTSTPTPAAAPAESSLAQPFIQLGIFSVEANARNAQSMAQGADLSARVIPGSAQGNAFWRVVVGPAQSTEARREMLEKVKSLGFADAYAVRR